MLDGGARLAISSGPGRTKRSLRRPRRAGCTARAGRGAAAHWMTRSQGSYWNGARNSGSGFDRWRRADGRNGPVACRLGCCEYRAAAGASWASKSVAQTNETVSPTSAKRLPIRVSASPTNATGVPTNATGVPSTATACRRAGTAFLVRRRIARAEPGSRSSTRLERPDQTATLRRPHGQDRNGPQPTPPPTTISWAEVVSSSLVRSRGRLRDRSPRAPLGADPSIRLTEGTR
jgi:hypothetical protein